MAMVVDLHGGNESAYLAFGDEISLQVSDTAADGGPLVGYIGIKTATATIDAQYVKGNNRTAPRPPQPMNCRFAVESSFSPDLDDARSTTREPSIAPVHEMEGSLPKDRLRGVPVIYGQNITLRHRPTQQVVAFTLAGVASDAQQSQDLTSKEMHDEILTSTKIVVTKSSWDVGTMTATMMILPGFKMRGLGERVRFGDAIILQRVLTNKESAAAFLFAHPSDSRTESSPAVSHCCVVSEQAVVGSEVDKSLLRVIPVAKREPYT
eukprot:SAG31_NODE_1425_length_8386_cov_6.678201_4_plen_265_part_00